MKIQEKRVPHTKLHIVQSFVKAGNISYTNTALDNADELNLAKEDIKAILLSLTTKDFDKSMTTKNDHTVWQDVYHPEHRVGKLYFKFTVVVSQGSVNVVNCKLSTKHDLS